jgi:hypothetical protein
MSTENLPQEPKDTNDAIDIIAISGYLKVDTDIGEIKLNSHNTIEIQPKGTPFGAQVTVEDDGSITPTLTFDTKKMREPKKNINPEEILDDALEEFFNGHE